MNMSMRFQVEEKHAGMWLAEIYQDKILFFFLFPTHGASGLLLCNI